MNLQFLLQNIMYIFLLNKIGLQGALDIYTLL